MNISATSAAPARLFTYKDLQQDGSYSEVSGDQVDLHLDRHEHYSNVGGLMIETDPTFTVSGSFEGAPVQLEVSSESQIANVGGLQIETGVVYHVDGQIANAPYHEDISTESQVQNHIETDRWKTLHGTSELSLHTVSETATSGGITWETDRYHTFNGTDSAGPVSLQVRGYAGEEQISVGGQASPTTLATLVALRPFLA